MGSFTKEEFEMYRNMVTRIKSEKDASKTPALFAELDKWIQYKGFDDRIIDQMERKIKLANEAEKRGIRVIK
jgi:hypothetical protein